jgi:hypothetical protein
MGLVFVEKFRKPDALTLNSLRAGNNPRIGG